MAQENKASLRNQKRLVLLSGLTDAGQKLNRRKSFIGQLIVRAVIAFNIAIPIFNNSVLAHKNKIHHHRGCHTFICDHHINILWYKLHHKIQSEAIPVELSSLARCVVEKESSNERYASNGTDISYYQWLPSTYNTAARMAGEEEKYPTDASLAEQTKAFNAYEPTHPGAWPVTVPECGG